MHALDPEDRCDLSCSHCIRTHSMVKPILPHYVCGPSAANCSSTSAYQILTVLSTTILTQRKYKLLILCSRTMRGGVI